MAAQAGQAGGLLFARCRGGGGRVAWCSVAWCSAHPSRDLRCHPWAASFCCSRTSLGFVNLIKCVLLVGLTKTLAWRGGAAISSLGR